MVHDMHAVLAPLSVWPAPQSLHVPPLADRWPTAHCTHVPLTSWNPALQLQLAEPTPLFEFALQLVHVAAAAAENLPATQFTQPDLKSFTRWPARHVSVHVDVRPFAPYVCAAHPLHPVSAVVPHGARNSPWPHAVVVQELQRQFVSQK